MSYLLAQLTLKDFISGYSILYLYIFPSCLCQRAGPYSSKQTGPGSYNVFFRILSELVFGFIYTITKACRLTDLQGFIEYNITNNAWHFGPTGSCWTGLSPTEYFSELVLSQIQLIVLIQSGHHRIEIMVQLFP